MLPFYWLHTCTLTTIVCNTQRICNYELQSFVVKIGFSLYFEFFSFIVANKVKKDIVVTIYTI